MTNDEFRDKMCTRKHRYLTRKEAKAVVKRMKKKGRKGNRPYKCIFCGMWHNGHPSPSKYDANGLILDDI